jgi:hypothetical protein
MHMTCWGKSVLIYPYDIPAFSKNPEEHATHVRQFKEILKAHKYLSSLRDLSLGDCSVCDSSGLTIFELCYAMIF